MKKPEQQADRRALPRAVGPEKPEDFALANSNVERLERPDWCRRHSTKAGQQGSGQAGPVAVRLGQTDGLDCVHSPSSRTAVDLGGLWRVSSLDSGRNKS